MSSLQLRSFDKYYFCFIVLEHSINRVRMATFTKIPEGETPVVDVDPSRRVAKIDKNIYGGFLE